MIGSHSLIYQSVGVPRYRVPNQQCPVSFTIGPNWDAEKSLSFPPVFTVRVSHLVLHPVAKRSLSTMDARASAKSTHQLMLARSRDSAMEQSMMPRIQPLGSTDIHLVASALCLIRQRWGEGALICGEGLGTGKRRRPEYDKAQGSKCLSMASR